MTWWEAPDWERRPLVFVEDQLYHTADLLAALADGAPALLAHTTVVGLDRPGPDTDATVAEWLERYPTVQVVAPVQSVAPRLRSITADDVSDAGAYARLIAGILRAGGLLVQDVHLSTLSCVPPDRWWESIYLAATVRGMFASRAPSVRFLSNKRGYAATFGRDLAGAGFDPRDVMDKSEVRTVVVPAVASLMTRLFPLSLRTRLATGRQGSWPVADHEEERRELEQAIDVLLWPTSPGWELSGHQVTGRVPLRATSPEAVTWLALIDDHLASNGGLPVVAVGQRLGGQGVERAEATNLAARHVHTLRSRLRQSSAIATVDHAYRLADGLSSAIVTLRAPSAE
jgi:hypothetical protein